MTAAESVGKDSNRSHVIHLHVQSNMNINKLAGSDQSLSESEGYVLEVLSSGRRRVDISGTTTSGVFYGLQSLLSLLATSDDGRTLYAVCDCVLY